MRQVMTKDVVSDDDLRAGAELFEALKRATEVAIPVRQRLAGAASHRCESEKASSPGVDLKIDRHAPVE